MSAQGESEGRRGRERERGGCELKAKEVEHIQKLALKRAGKTERWKEVATKARHTTGGAPTPTAADSHRHDRVTHAIDTVAVATTFTTAARVVALVAAVRPVRAAG